MKAGELKKLVPRFAEYLPASWKRVGNEYRRCEGDWVQFVVFYASRWDDKYEPRSCFEFLKKPGHITGTWLVSSLTHARTGTQRWVTLEETAGSVSGVFEEMARQFKPSIRAPMDASEVKRLLKEGIDYWPYPYALCVMAAEAGDKIEAERYLAACESSIGDKSWDWAVNATRELRACVKDAGTEELRGRLAAIASEKLRELKLVSKSK
jgi:hypothetical protein